MKRFALLLLNAWGPYTVSLWVLNKSLSGLTGNEIKAFIEYVPTVVNFLRCSFEITERVESTCQGLEIWAKIVPFLHIQHISDHEEYEQTTIGEFENNVKEFYIVGSKTFLTRTSVGDDETMYMHVLRFYMNRIAVTTFNRHKLGLGIYSMQGYERRNKESKNAIRRFNNHCGNLVASNLRRLWDVFFHEHLAY